MQILFLFQSNNKQRPKDKTDLKTACPADFDLKNIVVSPHIAGWTFESKQKLSNTLLNKILNFLNI